MKTIFVLSSVFYLLASSANAQNRKPLQQPLISSIYTADPSAHVFNGKIYVYPSHDTATGIPEDDLGNHFDMRDFHVLSMDSVGGKVTDNGIALSIKRLFFTYRPLMNGGARISNGN